MNISLVTYVVRSEDGSIDSDATVQKFAKDLAAYEAKQKHDQVAIIAALDTVLGKFPDTGLPMTFLSAMVAAELGANTPEAMSLVAERLDDCVKSNPQLYTQSKGRNGGTRKAAPKTA